MSRLRWWLEAIIGIVATVILFPVAVVMDYLDQRRHGS